MGGISFQDYDALKEKYETIWAEFQKLHAKHVETCARLGDVREENARLREESKRQEAMLELRADERDGAIGAVKIIYEREQKLRTLLTSAREALEAFHESDRRRGYAIGVEWSDAIAKSRRVLDAITRSEATVGASGVLKGDA